MYVSEVTSRPNFTSARRIKWCPAERHRRGAPTPDFQRVLFAMPVNENTTSTLTIVFDWLGALDEK